MAGERDQVPFLQDRTIMCLPPALQGEILIFQEEIPELTDESLQDLKQLLLIRGRLFHRE